LGAYKHMYKVDTAQLTIAEVRFL